MSCRSNKARRARPLCFVIDTDAQHPAFPVAHSARRRHRHRGVCRRQGLRQALARRAPDLVFLNIALEFADAIACVVALGGALLSAAKCSSCASRGSAVLAHVKSIGEQQRLQMLPVSAKAVRDQRGPRNFSQDLKLGHPPAVAGRIDLGRGFDERLDRVLVPAENRPAQKTAHRRRGLSPARAIRPTAC